jgi:hypothetical protein
MKEYTRDHSEADLAYVRLKSGERPFKPYGEALALPGISTVVPASRRIPANEGTTAQHTVVAERAAAALDARADARGAAPAPVTENVVSLADVRSQRKTPRF